MSNAESVARRRVGWIGLGKMGTPISARLVEHGFEVAALTRSAQARGGAERAGLRSEETIGAVASKADIVASAISDDAALLDIVFSKGGLRDALRSDQIFVDMSTVSPGASERVAEAMASHGVNYLRAPVSGSTLVAAQGALTAVISGPRPAVEQLQAFFAAFTRKTFYVGEKEEARYLKLALNTLVGGISALVAEALALGGKGGLQIADMMDALCQSAVGSPLLQYKRDMVVNGAYPPAFSVQQIMKDFDIIAEVSRRDHCPMPLVAHIRQQYEAAFANGCGELDFFVLVREAARIAQSRS